MPEVVCGWRTDNTFHLMSSKRLAMVLPTTGKHLLPHLLSSPLLNQASASERNRKETLLVRPGHFLIINICPSKAKRGNHKHFKHGEICLY